MFKYLSKDIIYLISTYYCVIWWKQCCMFMKTLFFFLLGLKLNHIFQLPLKLVEAIWLSYGQQNARRGATWNVREWRKFMGNALKKILNSPSYLPSLSPVLLLKDTDDMTGTPTWTTGLKEPKAGSSLNARWLQSFQTSLGLPSFM